MLLKFNFNLERFFMKTTLYCVLGLLLGLTAPPIQTFAREVPSAPATYVFDETGSLSGEARQRVESDLNQFDTETTHQVVVALFQSLEGDDLNDFTNRVFQQWKIGQAKIDNGVLLAIFLKDRKLRIEVGYGLEPVLTDVRSKRIIEDVIKPELRQGNIDQAVIRGTHALFETIRNPNADHHTKPRRTSVASLMPAILFWVCLYLLIRQLQNAQAGTHIGGFRRRDGSWRIDTRVGGGFGDFGGGGGGFGGGFSGGGGRSGGGGASGSW